MLQYLLCHIAKILNCGFELYDNDDTLLDIQLTDSNGVATFNETITEDTTFYTLFDGTEDYETCVSNNVTVEYNSNILFIDDCTGTDISLKYNVSENIIAEYVGYQEFNAIDSVVLFEDGYLELKDFTISSDVDWIMTFDLLHTNREAFGGIGIDTVLDIFSISDVGDGVHCDISSNIYEWNSFKIIKNSDIYSVFVNDSLVGSIVNTSIGSLKFNILSVGFTDVNYYIKDIKITKLDYLFYDKCDSATGLSNYGEIIRVEGTHYTATMEYDSDINSYELTSTSSFPKIYPITALNTLDNIQISMETRISSVVETKTGIGLAIIGSNNACVGTINSKEMGIMRHKFNNYQWQGNDDNLGPFTSNIWIKQILTRQGNNLINKFVKLDGTEITTITYTLDSNFNNQSDIKYGIDIGWYNKGSYAFVREIKAISLSSE